MRLIEWGEKLDYYPLDRGISTPQYWEDGDKYDAYPNPFLWNQRFWFDCMSAGLGRGERLENLMGGEL